MRWYVSYFWQMWYKIVYMKPNIVFISSKNFCDLHQQRSPIIIPFTVPDLVQERCKSLAKILNWFGVDFDASVSSRNREIRSVLRNHWEEFRNLLPRLWKIRVQTCSAQFREADTMHYTDNRDAFFHAKLYDYDDISDGWVRIHQKAVTDFIADASSRTLSMSEYLSAKWWEMTHWELEHHSIFCVMIPDTTLRRWYVTCLRILDQFSLFDKWSQSLWRPGEIKSGYARFIALGFKWVCVYPPNVTTKWHTLACYKWS